MFRVRLCEPCSRRLDEWRDWEDDRCWGMSYGQESQIHWKSKGHRLYTQIKQSFIFYKQQIKGGA